VPAAVRKATEVNETKRAVSASEFTTLENATRSHLGEPPRSPDEMRERLVFLEVTPEALFLARRSERYVGYACLNVAESDGVTVVHGWTGVRPEDRRHGLATTLKLRAAAWAKARGYRRIVTSPRATNAASLAANARVGYQPVDQVPVRLTGATE